MDRASSRPNRLLLACLACLTVASPTPAWAESGPPKPEAKPESGPPTSPELILPEGLPSLQTALRLPPWMSLELDGVAQPLTNPLGGTRQTGYWIQNLELQLELSRGLQQPSQAWTELDHWSARFNLFHAAGNPNYNLAIGPLFAPQELAYPAGLMLSEASIERKQGQGWFSFKAGVLPLNPEFVEVPILDNYVHASLNDTLNLSLWNLPIDPYGALGGVAALHPSPELSLRYGWFDLSTIPAITQWLGAPIRFGPPSRGTAQLLQVELASNRLAPSADTPVQACRIASGVVRANASCPTPVRVRSQLPGGLLRLGAMSTSHDGDAIYGTLTWRSGLPLGLDHRFWIGGSYSPDRDLVVAPSFVGAGLVLQGPLPGRPLDLVILGGGRAGLSSETWPELRSPYEAMIELGYKLQLNERFNLQPTLQWIFNPSGDVRPVAGILTAGVQVGLSF